MLNLGTRTQRIYTDWITLFREWITQWCGGIVKQPGWENTLVDGLKN
jgi:hypothetical protein